MSKELHLALGVLLDRLFRDPETLLHPVRLVGGSCFLLEKIFYRFGRLGGVLAYTLGALFWFCLGLFLEKFFGFLSFLFLYFFIAPHQLIFEVERILNDLRKGNLNSARTRLSFLVTRDTREMDCQKVIVTAIETLSENLVDAFVSPCLFFLAGGLPALFLFKFTETADSLFGYKTEKYRDFGWAFARMDDLLNFIPARVSVLLFAATGFLAGRSFLKPIVWAAKYGKKHESMNAGYPEAAFAALLGVRLGGEFIYFGRKTLKPFIGENEREPTPEVLSEAMILARLFVSLIFVVFITLVLAEAL